MRNLKLFLFTLFLSLNFLIGCSPKKEPAKDEETAVSQIVEEPVKGIIADGIVKASEYESFFSSGNTSISNMAVKEGQIVKKDDILITSANNSIIKCKYNKAVVYKTLVVNNQNVFTGQELIVLGNIESYIIEGYILEEVIKDVKVGAEVTIIPKVDTSKKYFGKVREIYEKAERNEKGEALIKVIITVNNRDDFLKDGYNVGLEINK